MKSFRTKKWLKGLMLAMLLIVGSTVFSASAKEVQAATAGFKTINGKTYYIKSDGSKQKGWLNAALLRRVNFTLSMLREIIPFLRFPCRSMR